MDESFDLPSMVQGVLADLSPALQDLAITALGIGVMLLTLKVGWRIFRGMTWEGGGFADDPDYSYEVDYSTGEYTGERSYRWDDETEAEREEREATRAGRY